MGRTPRRLDLTHFGMEFLSRPSRHQRSVVPSSKLVSHRIRLILGVVRSIWGSALPAPTTAGRMLSRPPSSMGSPRSSLPSRTPSRQTCPTPRGANYDPNLVPGPNPNGLRQRVVTSPTSGEGGVYLKPERGRTKIGSTGDFRTRYGPNAPDGIEVEIPQTRTGLPAGVDDSAYPWDARFQRRFDEEYMDRLIPPDARYRAGNARSPVDAQKWRDFRHIFGYGDLPTNFGQ